MLGVWLGLGSAGTLGNVHVELYFMYCASTALAYIKIFGFDLLVNRRKSAEDTAKAVRSSTRIAMGLLAVFGVLMRAFMPDVPW